MKVILSVPDEGYSETHREHLIRYLRFYYSKRSLFILLILVELLIIAV